MGPSRSFRGAKTCRIKEIDSLFIVLGNRVGEDGYVLSLPVPERSKQKAMLTIRAAQTSDHEHLLAIWLAAVRATHSFLSEEDIQALLPLVRDQALPALEVWVLVEDDAIIGFCGLSENKLEALFLHPDHFGKGGGRMLVEHARGLKGALLVDVNEQNPDAVRFYESVGFEVFDRSETDEGGRPFPLLHMREVQPRGYADGST